MRSRDDSLPTLCPRPIMEDETDDSSDDDHAIDAANAREGFTRLSDAEPIDVSCGGRFISMASLQQFKAGSTVFRREFDEIFCEVERNLPTINFDDSDENSDDDVLVLGHPPSCRNSPLPDDWLTLEPCDQYPTNNVDLFSCAKTNPLNNEESTLGTKPNVPTWPEKREQERIASQHVDWNYAPTSNMLAQFDEHSLGIYRRENEFDQSEKGFSRDVCRNTAGESKIERSTNQKQNRAKNHDSEKHLKRDSAADNILLNTKLDESVPKIENVEKHSEITVAQKTRDDMKHSELERDILDETVTQNPSLTENMTPSKNPSQQNNMECNTVATPTLSPLHKSKSEADSEIHRKHFSFDDELERGGLDLRLGEMGSGGRSRGAVRGMRGGGAGRGRGASRSSMLEESKRVVSKFMTCEGPRLSMDALFFSEERTLIERLALFAQSNSAVPGMTHIDPVTGAMRHFQGPDNLTPDNLSSDSLTPDNVSQDSRCLTMNRSNRAINNLALENSAADPSDTMTSNNSSFFKPIKPAAPSSERLDPQNSTTENSVTDTPPTGELFRSLRANTMDNMTTENLLQKHSISTASIPPQHEIGKESSIFHEPQSFDKSPCEELFNALRCNSLASQNCCNGAPDNSPFGELFKALRHNSLRKDNLSLKDVSNLTMKNVKWPHGADNLASRNDSCDGHKEQNNNNNASWPGSSDLRDNSGKNSICETSMENCFVQAPSGNYSLEIPEPSHAINSMGSSNLGSFDPLPQKSAKPTLDKLMGNSEKVSQHVSKGLHENSLSLTISKKGDNPLPLGKCHTEVQSFNDATTARNNANVGSGNASFVAMAVGSGDLRYGGCEGDHNGVTQSYGLETRSFASCGSSTCGTSTRTGLDKSEIAGTAGGVVPISGGSNSTAASAGVELAAAAALAPEHKLVAAGTYASTTTGIGALSELASTAAACDTPTSNIPAVAISFNSRSTHTGWRTGTNTAREQIDNERDAAPRRKVGGHLGSSKSMVVGETGSSSSEEDGSSSSDDDMQQLLVKRRAAKYAELVHPVEASSVVCLANVLPSIQTISGTCPTLPSSETAHTSRTLPHPQSVHTLETAHYLPDSLATLESHTFPLGANFPMKGENFKETQLDDNRPLLESHAKMSLLHRRRSELRESHRDEVIESKRILQHESGGVTTSMSNFQGSATRVAEVGWAKKQGSLSSAIARTHLENESQREASKKKNANNNQSLHSLNNIASSEVSVKLALAKSAIEGKEKRDEQDNLMVPPDAREAVVLVVAPRARGRICLATVLGACEERGLELCGVRLMRLERRHAALLGESWVGAQ